MVGKGSWHGRHADVAGLALAVRIRGRYRLAETPDAQRRCLQGMKGGSGRSAPSTRPLAKSAGMPKDWT